MSATAVTSRKSTKQLRLEELSLAQEQDDPNSIVLPNRTPMQAIRMRSGGKHRKKSKTACVARCFSIVSKNANTVGEENWTLMHVPDPMPDPGGKGLRFHPTAVMVDHVTGGILANNQLQVIMGEKAEIQAFRMYPPPGVTDASSHWESQAEAMHVARVSWSKRKADVAPPRPPPRPASEPPSSSTTPPPEADPPAVCPQALPVQSPASRGTPPPPASLQSRRRAPRASPFMARHCTNI